MERREQIADKILQGVFSIRQHMSRPAESLMRPVLNPGFFFLLSALKETDSMTMSEVSQMMMISKQQATQVTDRMVEAGYIRREADKQDRRIIKVTITQKGYDSLTECGEMIRQKTREKLDRLTDQDIEDLDRALNILYSLMLKLRGEAPAEKIL